MPASDVSDFTIYNDEFWGEFDSTLQQNSDAFNAASRGALTFATRRSKGHFEREGFAQHIEGLVSARDIESVAAAADLPIIGDEFVRPKSALKIGPAAATNDVWRKLGTNNEASIIVGRQAAGDIFVNMLNYSIASMLGAMLAADAAILAESVVVDLTSTTMSHDTLNTLNRLMGDKSGDIVCYIMNSTAWHALISDAITTNILNVSNVAIFEGTTGTLGRNVIVTDSLELDSIPTPIAGASYVIGLVAGGAQVFESDERELAVDLVTGLENLVTRVQGEVAFNTGFKGTKFSLLAADQNPDQAALRLIANHTFVGRFQPSALSVAEEVKTLGGVAIAVD